MIWVAIVLVGIGVYLVVVSLDVFTDHAGKNDEEPDIFSAQTYEDAQAMLRTPRRKLPARFDRGKPRWHVPMVIIAAVIGAVYGVHKAVREKQPQGNVSVTHGVYVSREYNFSVRSPSGWQRKERRVSQKQVKAVSFLKTGDPLDGEFSVAISKNTFQGVDASMTDTAVEAFLNALKASDASFVSTSWSRTYLNDVQVYDIKMVKNNGGKRLIKRMIIVPLGDLAYNLIAEAEEGKFDQVEGYFESFIRSFQAGR